MPRCHHRTSRFSRHCPTCSPCLTHKYAPSRINATAAIPDAASQNASTPTPTTIGSKPFNLNARLESIQKNRPEPESPSLAISAGFSSHQEEFIMIVPPATIGHPVADRLPLTIEAESARPHGAHTNGRSINLSDRIAVLNQTRAAPPAPSVMSGSLFPSREAAATAGEPDTTTRSTSPTQKSSSFSRQDRESPMSPPAQNQSMPSLASSSSMLHSRPRSLKLSERL